MSIVITVLILMYVRHIQSQAINTNTNQSVRINFGEIALSPQMILIFIENFYHKYSSICLCSYDPLSMDYIIMLIICIDYCINLF